MVVLSYSFIISNQSELFLIICEILGLLDNTLIANLEYSRSNRENLPLAIQMKLFKTP